MLILTRRVGEKINVTVGDVVIEILFCGTKGNQTRVGIKAPKDVLIDRAEVTARKAQEADHA